MSRAQAFEGFRTGVESLIGRVEPFLQCDSATLNTPTSAHPWTIGQIFEHLRMSDRGLLLPVLSAVSTLPRAEGDELRFTFIGRKIVASMPTSNIPVPKRVVPPKATYSRDVVQAYLDGLIGLRKALPQLELLDVESLKIKSPALPLVRYHAGDSLAISIAHGERHLAQAEAVRRAIQ